MMNVCTSPALCCYASCALQICTCTGRRTALTEALRGASPRSFTQISPHV